MINFVLVLKRIEIFATHSVLEFHLMLRGKVEAVCPVDMPNTRVSESTMHACFWNGGMVIDHRPTVPLLPVWEAALAEMEI
jgi:hypothetical protein